MDFSGIPEHAVRKESISVEVSSDAAFPWIGDELFRDGERIYIYWANTKLDITEPYNAWVAAQPKTHRVSFEWIEPA